MLSRADHEGDYSGSDTSEPRTKAIPPKFEPFEFPSNSQFHPDDSPLLHDDSYKTRRNGREQFHVAFPLCDPGQVTPSELEGSIGSPRKSEFDFGTYTLGEDSPYAEVRASVASTDDTEMPTTTFRMWVIGLTLCMTSSAANVFFNLRQPAPMLVPLTLLLAAHPFGLACSRFLPVRTFRLSRKLSFSLNNGPWSIKEHALVFIMANVSISPAYALNAIIVAEIFYKQPLGGYWFGVTAVLATQLTGFGLAGLCRRFVVWPASLIWPQNLIASALLNTLHADEQTPTDGSLTRFRYFQIVTCAAFVFYFLPGFLFQALSVFSFVCWIFPENIPVNQLMGVDGGLGFSVLTFDWSQVSWIGSPLMVPWWAQVHVFGGFCLFYMILTPILYYTNCWNLAYFPISANEPFDRWGKVYNVTRVLTPQDTFNLTAYNEYSPLYLPATYAVTYLLAFALSTCVLVHTVLYHGPTILNGIKSIQIEPDDIHAKLMRAYPEAPDWWYLAMFLFFFSLAVVAVEVWHVGVPVYALILAVLLPLVYILPASFIYAATGQGVTLNLMAQIIPSILIPGNPLANMIFKAYAVQTLSGSVSFVQDLKLGHYCKIPPRQTFLVQAVATTLSAFVQVGTKNWIFANMEGVCTKKQTSHLTCPHNRVFFSSSAIWGLIGPSRQFGKDSMYNPHLYALLIGALLPIPFWLLQRRYPNSILKKISIPIILNGVSYIPPATGINYTSWFAVGAIFQYFLRRRKFAWWSKFCYVTSAALDSGTIISLLVIFFTLQFPMANGGLELSWWGNEVFKSTADWERLPLRQVPEGGIPARSS